MRQVLPLFAAAIAVVVVSAAQSHSVPSDFSVTLQRTGCLGSCPEYKVTILADGSVQYEGQWYVHAKGARNKTIPPSGVEKLVQRLRSEDFFAWEEKKTSCLDLPEVHITVTMDGRHKHVLEGCNEQGKILALADAVDRAAGTKQWVGQESRP
jgi:hypothetical protein